MGLGNKYFIPSKFISHMSCLFIFCIFFRYLRYCIFYWNCDCLIKIYYVCVIINFFMNVGNTACTCKKIWRWRFLPITLSTVSSKNRWRSLPVTLFRVPVSSKNYKISTVVPLFFLLYINSCFNCGFKVLSLRGEIAIYS